MSDMENILKQLSIVQGKAKQQSDEPKIYIVLDKEKIPKQIVQKFSSSFKQEIQLNKQGIRILEDFFNTRNRKVLAKRLVLYILAMSEKKKREEAKKQK